MIKSSISSLGWSEAVNSAPHQFQHGCWISNFTLDANAGVMLPQSAFLSLDVLVAAEENFRPSSENKTCDAGFVLLGGKTFHLIRRSSP